MWYRGWFDFNGTNAIAWSIFAATLAAVWWFSAIYLRDRRDRPYDSPSHLFRDLCRAHRLSKREIELLRNLALDRDLDTPALLFVRDDYLTDAGEETQKLRERLFAA